MDFVSYSYLILLISDEKILNLERTFSFPLGPFADMRQSQKRPLFGGDPGIYASEKRKEAKMISKRGLGRRFPDSKI